MSLSSNAYFQYTSKTKCIPCGDRFLCGSLNEKIKIKQYNENFRKTTRQHCSRRTGFMHESSKRKNVKMTEELKRHSVLIDYMEEIVVHRKGKLKKRFSKGFYLGEIKLFTQPTKSASKEVFKRLKKSNFIIPVLSFEDFKDTHSTERPRSFYKTYIKNLMTEEPYHLTDKEFGNKLYSFTLYPDDEAKKYGKALTRNVASVSGSASGGGSLGGGSGGGQASGAISGNSKTSQTKKGGTEESFSNFVNSKYGGFGGAPKKTREPASTLDTNISGSVSAGSIQVAKSSPGAHMKYSGFASDRRKVVSDSSDTSSTRSPASVSVKGSTNSCATNPDSPSCRVRNIKVPGSVSVQASNTSNRSKTTKSRVLRTGSKKESSPDTESVTTKSIPTKVNPEPIPEIVSVPEIAVPKFKIDLPSTVPTFESTIAMSQVETPRVGIGGTLGEKEISKKSIEPDSCNMIFEQVKIDMPEREFCGKYRDKFDKCSREREERVLKTCKVVFGDSIETDKTTTWGYEQAEKCMLTESYDKCRFETGIEQCKKAFFKLNSYVINNSKSSLLEESRRFESFAKLQSEYRGDLSKLLVSSRKNSPKENCSGDSIFARQFANIRACETGVVDLIKSLSIDQAKFKLTYNKIVGKSSRSRLFRAVSNIDPKTKKVAETSYQNLKSNDLNSMILVGNQFNDLYKDLKIFMNEKDVQKERQSKKLISDPAFGKFYSFEGSLYTCRGSSRTIDSLR
ncbi:MAG: hypothetical protein AB8E15_01025 [Bdellovibrionales bacterium]